MLFVERVLAVTPSPAKFVGDGCIRDMVIRVKLKEDSKFKCQTCTNQQTDIS